MIEAKVSTDPVAIDIEGGFLYEWWSVFWDIFISKRNENSNEKAVDYQEIQELKRQVLLQKEIILGFHQQNFVAQQGITHCSLDGAANLVKPENLMQHSVVNFMPMKHLEERRKPPQQGEGFDAPFLKKIGESPAQLLEANKAVLYKNSSYAEQPSASLGWNTGGNVRRPVQQCQVWPQSLPGNSQESLQMDLSAHGGSGFRHFTYETSNHGSNNVVPLEGWTLTDQPIPTLRQRKRPLSSTIQQHQTLSWQQQQQLLLQTNGSRGRDCVPVENTRCYGVGSQMHFPSQERATSHDQTDLRKNLQEQQLQQQEQFLQHEQQQQQQLIQQQHQEQYQQNLQKQQLHQHQLQQQEQFLQQEQQQQQLIQQEQYQQSNVQNGRKRRHSFSSGAANSNGTVNTPVSCENSLPSTPSTHIPVDMMTRVGTINPIYNASINLIMHGSDGLVTPSNQQADIDNSILVGNVDSFLATDYGKNQNVEDYLDSINCSSGSPVMHKLKALTEVQSLSSISEVGCCHFSSDGMFLATGGHDKKAFLWNVDTLEHKSTLEQDNSLISDVRFSPDSTHLATSSNDSVVRIWDVDNTSNLITSFERHSKSVNSVDFHPRDGDILCSCDEDGEICYWSVNKGSLISVSKGGKAQLRFRPNDGQYLAAVADNAVVVFDVQKSTSILCLQEYDKPVRSICWDDSGNYIASLTEDRARILSVTEGGRCIQEFRSTDKKLQSCIFHPKYPKLLIIGCDKNFVFWNLRRNKVMEDQAHSGLISALAKSSATGMIASASRDLQVKLWK